MITTIAQENFEIPGRQRVRKAQTRGGRRSTYSSGLPTVASERKPFPLDKKYADVTIGERSVQSTGKKTATMKNPKNTMVKKVPVRKRVISSRANQWIEPFPLSHVPTSSVTKSVKSKVVLKPPKTVDPIRPLQPRVFEPKQTGSLGNLVRANPGLKPSLVKKEKVSTPKPSKIATRKNPLIKQPTQDYLREQDRPIKPGSKTEKSAKPAPTPAKVHTASKVVGWVIGGILVYGGISYFIYLQSIKKS